MVIMYVFLWTVNREQENPQLFQARYTKARHICVSDIQVQDNTLKEKWMKYTLSLLPILPGTQQNTRILPSLPRANIIRNISSICLT